MLVCVLFPTLCLLDVPPPTHAVTMDSLYLPGEGEPPSWMRPAPPRAERRAGGDPVPLSFFGPRGPRHVIALTAAGETLFDGCPVRGPGLRERLGRVARPGAAEEGWLELRPEAEAPWPRVDEALAILAGAAVRGFRLDNAPFRNQNDQEQIYGKPPPPPPPAPLLPPTARRSGEACAAEAERVRRTG
jgi:hypothetical protein